MSQPGFRVLPAPPRLSAQLLDRYHGLASSNVADAMGRFGFMDPGMQSRSGLALCGLAVTVQCRPADNLMVHKALQLATPGDIVVVSTCGNTTSAVFGELMCHTAAAAKLGGIVVDGAIRLVGADRNSTAVAVASMFFPTPLIVGIASGATFADAMSGGAYLARLGGPILLTYPTSLPASTSNPSLTMSRAS